MLNRQAPEHRIQDSGHTLQVHSVFYTIQGEGPYTGWPAVFIRLAGCNLQCPGCDTIYADHRDEQEVHNVMERVEHLHGLHPSTRPSMQPLVVITGGEPFRQNLTQLAKHLISAGYLVQVETNGTLPPSPGLPNDVRIVCSPKAGKVAFELLSRICAYKYVLAAGDEDDDGLPRSVLGGTVRPARPHAGYYGPIYLSPLDVQVPGPNLLNTEAAVKSCLKHGHILNLQVHKIVNLP